MKIQKKHYLLIAGAGIIILYLATRLYNLTALPIFTDEAIYIRWAQTALVDPSQRFISLTDGKQPLLIWLGMIFLNFINDPLVAMRLVSVVAGLGTVIGIFLLTKEVFGNKRTACVASLLYTLFPFALVYDKLALYESLLALIAVWALYLEVLLVRRKRLDIAIMTALVIGAGLLTKSSAQFFIYLLPASLLLFNFKSKSKNKEFLKWLGLAVIVVCGSMLCAAILRLSPYFHIIEQKNTTFVYPIGEWLQHPFTYVFDNTNVMLGWLVGYITLPVIALIVAAFFVNRQFLKEKVLIGLWFIIPFAALAFLGKSLFPRYIFFMTIPLLVLAAFGLVSILDKIKAKKLQIIVVVLFLSMMLVKGFYILTDFSKAPIPQADRIQLIDGYASGIGIEKTVAFLNEKSQSQQIYVGTQGTFGLMPDALQVYLRDNPNIAIQGFWPIEKTPPDALIAMSKEKPTYFIFYAPCQNCEQTGIALRGWPLKKIFQVQRQDKTYYTLYEVVSMKNQ